MTQHAVYDSTAGELAQLRDCVQGLARIIELPVHVDGGDEVELVCRVLDALIGMLGLGWAATRLHDPNGGRPVDVR